MWMTGSGFKYGWSLAPCPAAYLPLCSPVPNRPRAQRLGTSDVGNAMVVPTTGSPELGELCPGSWVPGSWVPGSWVPGSWVPGSASLGGWRGERLVSAMEAPHWALQERDSTFADTSYVMNCLKFASGTFLTPVMQLISPKETWLEASGVSEGAKQKSAFRAWAVLASVLAAPRHRENCVSSRWFQAPGTHFWSLPLSSSPIFSLVMTQTGARGVICWGKNNNNNNDKSCWCLFCEKSRHLCSASYARPAGYLFFPSPSSLVGGAGMSKVPKHLNEKDAIVGPSLLWTSVNCWV